MKDNFPFHIELAYSKVLKKLVTEIEDKFKEIFLKGKSNSIIKLKKYKVDSGEVLKEYADDLINKQEIKRNATDDKEREFLEYFEELLTTEYAFDLCIDYILETIGYSIDEVNKSVSKIIGVAFKEQPYYDEETIREILEENIKLIKAEPTKYLRTYDKQIAKLVEEKIEEGLTLDDLVQAIQNTTGIEKNRAALIATDQVGNIFAETTKSQFKGIGLKKFIWVTAGDARVRPTHAERNGNIYEWDNPPDGEIPGRPIRCRCTADIVESEVLMLAA